MTQIQRVISQMQFESSHVSEMAEQKIKSLINSKCGGVAAASASSNQPAAGSEPKADQEKEESAAAATESEEAK